MLLSSCVGKSFPILIVHLVFSSFLNRSVYLGLFDTEIEAARYVY